jgi:hypothetical protein
MTGYTKRILFVSLMALLIEFIAMVPVHAAPQQQNANWDNLKQLTPGAEIKIVLNDVKSCQGQFASANDGAIVVRLGAGDQTFVRQNVLRVSVKGESRRRRNALIGAAVGAGVGLGIGAGVDASQKCGLGPCFPNLGIEVLTPVGAITGALVGAALPARGWRDVYRAR